MNPFLRCALENAVRDLLDTLPDDMPTQTKAERVVDRTLSELALQELPRAQPTPAMPTHPGWVSHPVGYTNPGTVSGLSPMVDPYEEAARRRSG